MVYKVIGNIISNDLSVKVIILQPLIIHYDVPTQTVETKSYQKLNMLAFLFYLMTNKAMVLDDSDPFDKTLTMIGTHQGEDCRHGRELL